MMRVFRPTSPMNMGVWILAGAAPTAIATGLLINRGGWLGRVGEATGYASGLFGAALSGYTAVLVSNSVIPVWQDARRWMPPQFVASSMSAAAGVLQLFPLGSRADRITRVFGAIGRTADLAAAKLVETSASVTPRVSEPFRRGLPSTLWKAASILTGVSLALTLIPRKSQTVRRLAGACGLAGSLCLRLAVHTITQASARDARASFDQQRDRPALSR
jgi:hypothetical protein